MAPGQAMRWAELDSSLVDTALQPLKDESDLILVLVLLAAHYWEVSIHEPGVDLRGRAFLPCNCSVALGRGSA